MSAKSSRTAAFATALGTTGAVYQALRKRAPGEPAHWRRTNYAGRTVDLYAGPAAALGAAAGSAIPARTRGAAALAVLAAGACGAYDDSAGAGDPRRGFRAHLTALRQGEVTSGAVKLFGIGAAALMAGALLRDRPVDRILAGVVIAGSAHGVNLLDVRPGRACLAVLALSAPGLLRRGTAGALAAVPLGAAAAVVVDDLGERTMLGDAGAHALGAALGAAIAAGNGRAGLALHALGVVAAAAYGDRAGRRVPSPR
jgi:UDP-N-acetylmuramyl pentapeptide phosphotransferase/UDP-N-acetylglucosamine-1-phosphate transferase